MKTIAFIRPHRLDEVGTLVYDEIAQYVDGLFFQPNNVQSLKIWDMMQTHPKCCGIREYPGTWTNRQSLDMLMKWADEIQPEIVLWFDEDELPPPQFGYWLDLFRELPEAKALMFRCIYCYGEPDKILLRRPGQGGSHTKVWKWQSGLSQHGTGQQCRINVYARDGLVACPFPYRHLTIMTNKMRQAWRQAKKLSHKLRDTKTISFDPNRTTKQWKRLGAC